MGFCIRKSEVRLIVLSMICHNSGVKCWWMFATDLLNISLSSCSETNWPRLATKRVEQGAAEGTGGMGGPTPAGEPRAGAGSRHDPTDRGGWKSYI